MKILQEQAILTPIDGASFSYFGSSVAISDNTAIVGAHGRNASTGGAYIYILNETSWSQKAILTASDGVPNDYFGHSVAISGDTAIVGAHGKNSNTGAAYVYVFNGASWSQKAILTANDGAPDDYFGWSVAISGDTAIVGAYGKNSNIGAVYIYVYNGTSWTQQAKLTASTGILNDLFGSSVSISGDNLIVGSCGKNSNAGAAYIYVPNGTSWVEQAELMASDAASGDYFGFSTAISGNTTIVGAPYKNSTTGAAYIYVYNGSSWIQQPKLTAINGASNDAFGFSVAILNDTAIVGVPGRNTNRGSAYIYFSDGPSWTQQAELVASDGTSDDFFAYSLTISYGTAIAGAPDGNSSIGAAYFYFTNPITYIGNGNTSGNPPVDNTKYVQGDTLTIPDNGSLRKIGYAFMGWNTKPDGTGTDYLPGDTFTMGTENIILYAKWASLLTRGIKLF